MRINIGNAFDSSDGFTLIETLVAMVVLIIGIFSLYAMQTTAMKYNASASAMTTSASWASDRIELLLALDYDDPLLDDGNTNGNAGLDDVGSAADGSIVSPDGRYTVNWNAAAYMTPNPSASTDSTLKALRIIVQHNTYGSKQVVLNYYKQKVY